MPENNLCQKFINRIFLNFKKSNNIFYKNNKEKYSYKESFEKICKLMNFIQSNKTERVVIFSDKSHNYYLTVISIIFVGKTWIQISPNIPLARIKKIIKISKCKFGFYDESFNNSKIISKLKINLFRPEEIYSSSFKKKITSINKINPNKTAMIFFTSGSTSDPKGVAISYKSFIYSAFQQIKNLNYKKNNEIFSDYHDSSFVMSLNIIFPATYLSSCISPLTDYYDKINPIDHIKRNKVSVLITVPSFFLYINNFIKKKIKIKKIIFCGESFSLNILKLCINKIKFNNLYNCYGATELSPWVYFYKYSKKHDSIINKYNQVPIGKPFEGTLHKINNKNELCVSGPALSKGYLIKSQNKNRFFRIKNRRYYNTGDVCKKISKNIMFILGRNDKQIKLKGFRINLLEIENLVKKIPKIEFVMCFKKSKKEKLVLLVVSKIKNIENKIKGHLLKNLPKYMFPSEIFIKKKIKLNKNGKVDRNFYFKSFDK